MTFPNLALYSCARNDDDPSRSLSMLLHGGTEHVKRDPKSVPAVVSNPGVLSVPLKRFRFDDNRLCR